MPLCQSRPCWRRCQAPALPRLAPRHPQATAQVAASRSAARMAGLPHGGVELRQQRGVGLRQKLPFEGDLQVQ